MNRSPEIASGVSPLPLTDPSVQALVARFAAQVPEASERATIAMVTEIPRYAAVADPLFFAEVRDHVVANFTAMATVLAAGRPITREELTFLRAPATRRVHHRFPLADFLHAFRVGQRAAWDAILGCADPECPDAALALAGPVIDYINIASTHVAEVYLEAEQLLALGGERVRRDALDDLLAGRRPPPGPRADALRSAGLLDAGAFLVVSAAPFDVATDEHQLRAIAQAIGRSAGGTGTPLAVLRGDEVLAVLPADAERSRAVGDELDRVHERFTSGALSVAIGASTLVGSIDDLPSAYAEATQARTLSRAAHRPVYLWQLTALDYLTLAGNETADRLIAPPVARFITEDLAAHGVMAQTLREYAAADLSPKAAAVRLHCHVNTVHNRLRRIAERTGYDLRSFHDVNELLVALRLIESRGPRS